MKKSHQTTKAKVSPKSKKSPQEKNEVEKTPSRSPFREIAEIIFYGLTILIFLKGYVWQNFQIPTKSMENTLLIGDHITANTFIFKKSSKFERAILPFRDIRRGDVLVFKFPGEDRQDWIKRCIGIPGDKFEMHAQRLYINNEPVPQPFAYYKDNRLKHDRDPDNRNFPLNFDTQLPGIENAEPGMVESQSHTVPELIARTRQTLSSRPFTNYRERDPEGFKKILERLESAPEGVIPPGFYVMMGDNRNFSMDSRAWGMVPKELVEGRAYWIWWSYGEDEGSHEKQGLDLILSYLRVVWRFATHTHFSRTFDLIR